MTRSQPVVDTRSIQNAANLDDEFLPNGIRQAIAYIDPSSIGKA